MTLVTGCAFAAPAPPSRLLRTMISPMSPIFIVHCPLPSSFLISQPMRSR